MNYIEQIKGFWLAQEVNQLGTSEIAMYFYMLEIWNKTGWTGTFYRNNYKVMADLSIRSFKTLQSVRDRLQEAGILSFKQRNGVANVQYLMTDLSKFYKGSGVGLAKVGDKVKERFGKGSGEVNININQTKRNQTSKSHSPPDGGTPKKNKDDFSKVAYWKKFVETWDDFYKAKTGEKHLYQKKDWGCLKKVYDFLKRRAESKNFEWTEETAIDGFKMYLQKAYEKDHWLKENFSIPNILSQFNQIANGNAKTNSKKTGGAVDTRKAFAKIDEYYSRTGEF